MKAIMTIWWWFRRAVCNVHGDFIVHRWRCMRFHGAFVGFHGVFVEHSSTSMPLAFMLIPWGCMRFRGAFTGLSWGFNGAFREAHGVSWCFHEAWKEGYAFPWGFIVRAWGLRGLPCMVLPWTFSVLSWCFHCACMAFCHGMSHGAPIYIHPFRGPFVGR